MNNNDKIGIKEIHETLWRCRDFELSNLWQRSIFLTAFLVLCFTGYGAVLIKIPDCFKIENANIFLFLNVVAYCISLIGIVFSILWIKMGKGSKAWYENYESAIGAFEGDKKYSSKKVRKIGGFRYTNLKHYRKNDLNSSILSGKAGAYSVSKINTAIGQVFLFIWWFIALFHIILFSYKLNQLNYSNCIIFITVLTGIILVIANSLVIGNSRVYKSSSLNDF
jgi:hypothetical protein